MCVCVCLCVSVCCVLCASDENVCQVGDQRLVAWKKHFIMSNLFALCIIMCVCVCVCAGERVCVDLANMLVPGEGMLVGSFASGLLLVHSECEESE